MGRFPEQKRLARYEAFSYTRAICHAWSFSMMFPKIRKAAPATEVT